MVTDEREGPESTSGASTSGVRPPSQEGWLAVARRFWRVWVLAAVALLLMLWFRGAVLLFAFATLVAYLLEPLVRRMAPGLGGRRGLSVLLLYVVLLGLGAGFIGGVVPGVVSDL